MRPARPVAVLGGVRIPFCRQNTAYSDVGNLGMSVRTLGALVEKFGLHGQQLGEVAMGAVIKHSSDWNLGREAALSSGLSPLTPGITLQRACGTSLDGMPACPVGVPSCTRRTRRPVRGSWDRRPRVAVSPTRPSGATLDLPANRRRRGRAAACWSRCCRNRRT